MSFTADDIAEISTDEVRIVSVDFTGKLDSGELLSGTPTITADAGAGLTLTNKAVNSEAITVNSVACAIGEAVQFKADATAANAGRWAVEIVCGTDAGQTLYGRVMVRVVDT